MAEAAASRGVITIVTGRRRYIEMAIALARSLEKHSPDLPRAVITDSADPVLASLYERRIPIDQGRGNPLFQRLHLDHYSPFEETLAIDVDSLVLEDIEWTFGLFSEVPFGVIGEQIRSGYWYGDVRTILERIGRTEMPRFNGGFYYCDRSSEARQILRTAREVAERYQDLGLPAWRGGMSDEPVLGIALSLHGVRAVDDGGRCMRTPIGMQGWLRVDVLEGRCRFKKYGAEVSPAVVHFAGPFADQRDPRGAFYRREAEKLVGAALGESRGPLARVRDAIACGVACLVVNVWSLYMVIASQVRLLRRRGGARTPSGATKPALPGR